MREFTLFVFALLSIQFAHSQFFNPNMEDSMFLDMVQNDLATEVDMSKTEMMEQVKVLEGTTRNFLGAKLKENVFRALRVLSEKELELDLQEKQDEEDEEEEEEESETAPRTTQNPANINATTVKLLIPKVANILKLIFGPAQPKTDLTDVIESASKLLPNPLEAQLLGVVELMMNKTGNDTIEGHFRQGRQQGNGTTESYTGFEEEESTQPSRIALFSNLQTQVQNGIGTLVKMMPDLFLGAREAVKLFLRIEDMILDGDFEDGFDIDGITNNRDDDERRRR